MPADRLAALRAVPGCGRDTVLYGQDHLVAIVHAKHCDACFTLLVDAVIAHAVARAVKEAPHPEAICHHCGGPNPIWSAPNEEWNAVVESEAGIYCPTCYAVMGDAKAGSPQRWRITQHPDSVDRSLERTAERFGSVGVWVGGRWRYWNKTPGGISCRDWLAALLGGAECAGEWNNDQR